MISSYQLEFMAEFMYIYIQKIRKEDTYMLMCIYIYIYVYIISMAATWQDHSA